MVSVHNLMGTGATKIATNTSTPSSSGVSMPGNGRGYVSSGYSMPSRGGQDTSGWFIGAVLFALAAGYWSVGYGNIGVAKARNEAAVIRAFAQSSAVKSVVRSAMQSSGSQRKRIFANNKAALLTAFKTTAQKVPGAQSLTNDPVPPAVVETLETKLIKAPATTTQALLNRASSREQEAFPLYPKLVTDPKLFGYTGTGLLGGLILCTVMGVVGFIPKRQPRFLAPLAAQEVATPLAVAPNTIPSPRLVVPTAPTITAKPTLSTPFPPPPESVPTINPPTRGSIAAGVAAVASSSSEVTRLVKRLEELETLSEKLKDERDETRKELSWTQVALDDFKRRVSDATTMAAASAAQSAGASEQRAAQAEMRVTEAVEHINEALQRAVEAEQGVSHVKELAQTAEERAAHAEVRAHEMQFQLARAMERLADLERLAANTRIGGVPNAGGGIHTPLTPPALPAPDRSSYSSAPSPLDGMLAAAARTNAKPASSTSNPTPDTGTETTEPPSAEVRTSLPVSPVTPRGNRTPPPRLTNVKMADIEAGLKLAHSIRSRTQKAASNISNEE